MAVSRLSANDLAKFQQLKSIDDIATFFGTTRKRLFFHLYSPKRPPYRIFSLPKASGDKRTISVPPKVIAAFQHKLLQCMTGTFTPKSPVHGFALKRNVATNAKFHVGARLILNIDLVDFFSSIHFGRVRGMFQSRPYSFPPRVATILAQICCNNGIVPQGAATSPILSNLICRNLDRDIDKLCRRHRCKYTRYADDITISTEQQQFDAAILDISGSGNDPTPEVGHPLFSVIEKHSFTINREKTRVRGKNQRQQITGLVVNNKVNVRREFVRNIRALIHNIKHEGLTRADSRFHNELDQKHRLNGSPSLIAHLQGKLDFLRMVRGSGDPLFLRYAIAAQKIAKHVNFNAIILGDSAKTIKFLQEAVWVVIGLDSNGHDICQGTAFTLAGSGLISARHTFEQPAAVVATVRRWELFKPTDPTTKFRIAGYRKHDHFDLTVLQTNAISAASFKMAEYNPTTSSGGATIVGFPQWHSLADRLLVANGRIIQTRIISTVSYFLTDIAVRSGNSGGPILDESGAAIGVALYDATSAVAPNGGISLSHLNSVLSSPLQPLP